MKKRMITICVLAAMLLSCASCGSTETGNDETTKSGGTDTTVGDTTAEPTEYDKYPLPEKDMDGFNLRFCNYDDSWLTWTIKTLDVEEENGDKLNDAVYARNRRVEAKYNCQITEELVANPGNSMSGYIMSGDDLYDIIMVHDEAVSSLYCQGYLDSWDTLEFADTSRSWWDNNANEVFQIGGKQFAAVGDFTLSMVCRGFVMLFNKDMVSDLNLDESLYDMVRDNKWTLDGYASIAKNFVKDLNGDGTMDGNDQYATTGAVKLHFGSLVTGCGVKYISTDSEGVPQFAIPGNTYAFDVFEKIFNIHNGTNIFYNIAKANAHDGSNEAITFFKNKQTAFNGTSMKGVANFRDANFDIGILPYPKYDENQENYYILTSGGTVATIPVTLPEDRHENVGIILDSLCRDSQQNLLPTYKEIVLKTKYARDEDSAEMLDIIFGSLTYDLGLSVWPQDTYYKYMESYLKMTDNFSSTTDKIKSIVEKDISDLVSSLDK